MASFKIDVVPFNEFVMVAELYGRIFRPARDVSYFRRRFAGRYNVLPMIAAVDDQPAGFYIGFEFRPTIFYSWLFGVLPAFRRRGLASKMHDAVQDWSRQHGYDALRFECHNQHRPMLRMGLSKQYDIVGVREDESVGDRLIILEKAIAN